MCHRKLPRQLSIRARVVSNNMDFPFSPFSMIYHDVRIQDEGECQSATYHREGFEITTSCTRSGIRDRDSKREYCSDMHSAATMETIKCPG